MTSQGHVIPLSEEECRQLLHERSVARISWASRDGILILPVNYVVQDEIILVRVSSDSVLGELVEGHDVAVQIEDVDEMTANGWSVLVRGRSERYSGEVEAQPQPWAPGRRDLLISVTPRSISGRSVSAD